MFKLVQIDLTTGEQTPVFGSDGQIRGSREWVDMWAARFNAFKSNFRCEAIPA